MSVLCVASPSIYDSSLSPMIREGKKYKIKRTVYKFSEVYYELKEHPGFAYKSGLFMTTSEVNELYSKEIKLEVYG